ncbi:maleylpyruvate isomerase N-terminal domain-containing protein [Actinopolymorpha pittospori]|uniref:Uncharacterized protein (TIGR03083 family) n=1 Tax=Actinopolymorpha pittospori TaxID=648752 RepID=A0A927N656_9ACTN|nr:maleylpyruvate isomerase N-terminal domain-containing protein [Actinopolymorpha pittospori]MBE1610978.1 uncharacterized protein (TIGR03083 family) [Actinopolymorpha pittospori]
MRDDSLLAFEDEARTFDAVLCDLTEDDFAKATNCPPWNVKELVVHVGVVLPTPGALGDAPPGDPDLREPADYYRRLERGTTGYRDDIVKRTQDFAVGLADGAAAAAFLTQRWRTSLAEWTARDLDRLVTSRGGVTRLRDYIVTRVISHAAHGLDLAVSLGRAPWTTETALAIMRPVFVSLLGGEPPAALRWTDADLFARGTGRRALDPADRDLLGSWAARFPLLS